MKLKRGKDHTWEVRRYLGDIALYANCKCGFEYDCSAMSNGDKIKVEIVQIYNYCPVCGARKLRYNPEPIRLNYYRW